MPTLQVDIKRDSSPRVTIVTRPGRKRSNYSTHVPPTYACVVDGIMKDSFPTKRRANKWCSDFLRPYKEQDKINEKLQR